MLMTMPGSLHGVGPTFRTIASSICTSREFNPPRGVLFVTSCVFRVHFLFTQLLSVRARAGCTHRQKVVCFQMRNSSIVRGIREKSPVGQVRLACTYT